jgi:hypothetical protein
MESPEATARLKVIVDLPTPPLRLTTAKVFIDKSPHFKKQQKEI